MYRWEALHPQMTHEMLGLIPGWFDRETPETANAVEIIDNNYQHGGGWQNFNGFTLDIKTLKLRYPGNPPVRPLAKLKWGTETVVFYEYSWVCIIQDHGEYKVARID